MGGKKPKSWENHGFKMVLYGLMVLILENHGFNMGLIMGFIWFNYLHIMEYLWDINIYGNINGKTISILEVSINRASPKWMVYNGKSH